MNPHEQMKRLEEALAFVNRLVEFSERPLETTLAVRDRLEEQYQCWREVAELQAQIPKARQVKTTMGRL